MATKIDSNKYVSFNGQTLVFPSGLGTDGQVLSTDGSGTLAYHSIEWVVSSTTNINGAVAADYTLLSVPTGKNLIISKAILRITAQTGLTGTLRASIGSNVTFDNLFSARNLTGLNSTTQFYTFSTSGVSSIMQSTETVKLRILTAFSGTVTLAVELLGYQT